MKELVVSTGNVGKLKELQAYLADSGWTLSLKPESLDFNIVLEAWANSDSPRGAERADAIVEHMKKLHDMGHLDVQPTGETYVILFRCWEKSGHPLAKDRMESIKTEIEAIDAGLSGDQVKLFVPATVT